MSKPTLHDVAAEAGVSYATADRVLNKRGGVAKKSQTRVEAAIAKLGYQRDITAANLSRRRLYRFHVLLPNAAGGFFASLRQLLSEQEEVQRKARQAITITPVPPFDPKALALEIDRAVGAGCDGLCVVAVNHPEVSAALGRARAQSIPVVTLVADSAEGDRDCYVGIDNRTAGRTAADLILLSHRSHAQRGLILPVMGSLQARDHAERYAGFCEVVADQMDVLPPLETGDDPTRLNLLLTAALAAEPGITGLYNLGAGVPGLIAALDHRGNDNIAGRPVVVSHELCDATRKAVADGLIDAVIDQKPARELSQALAALTALSDGLALDPTAGQITPAVHFKHNMPPQPAAGPNKGA